MRTVGSLGRLAVRQRGAGAGRRCGAGAGRRGGGAARRPHGRDLEAQTHALGFYERLGYEAYGEEFLDAGIGHLAMRRKL